VSAARPGRRRNKRSTLRRSQAESVSTERTQGGRVRDEAAQRAEFIIGPAKGRTRRLFAPYAFSFMARFAAIWSIADTTASKVSMVEAWRAL
jgi:hypothetical protein